MYDPTTKKPLLKTAISPARASSPRVSSRDRDRCGKLVVLPHEVGGLARKDFGLSAQCVSWSAGDHRRRNCLVGSLPIRCNGIIHWAKSRGYRPARAGIPLRIAARKRFLYGSRTRDRTIDSYDIRYRVRDPLLVAAAVDHSTRSNVLPHDERPGIVYHSPRLKATTRSPGRRA